jgi:uncharacterized repeat protein (TIGR03803 family)
VGRHRLCNFAINDPNGDQPNGGLIFDPAGHLYGTTLQGGPDDNGVVFELARDQHDWMETVLHAGGSWANVIRDQVGNLYGTTETTVFELRPDSHGWRKTILHTFCSKRNCMDGADAFAGVIFGADGSLYGTTAAGGAYKAGTVYEVQHTTNGWKEHVLHSFPASQSDGSQPSSGVVFDHSGNLYGTTSIGGGTGCEGGCGIVYQLTPSADGRWTESILYNFGNGKNGQTPEGGVIIDKAGNLYGVTAFGGTGCECGVVYKLTKQSSGKWKYTILHSFTGQDGAQPAASLIFDDKGNLYGTTAAGGEGGAGVVFELTP